MIIGINAESDEDEPTSNAEVSMKQFKHTGAISRCDFFSELEMLIGSNTQFQLIMLKVNNQHSLNSSVGYLQTELWIAETLGWIGRVLEYYVANHNFNVAKVESGTFAISIPGLRDQLVRSELLKCLVTISKGELASSLKAPAAVKVIVGTGLFPESGNTLNELLNFTETYLRRHELIKSRQPEASPNIIPFTATDLESAIGNDELELWYQPKVCLKTNATVGYEGLIRWRHPEHGVLLPNSFLYWYDFHGLNAKLNRWIINAGFKKCREFMDNGHDLTVALNLEASSLLDGETVNAIDEFLQFYGVPCENIEFEIIETVAILRGDEKYKAIHELKEKGYRIAIDDFGTGNNNISYLTFLPADTVKLDRLFSSNIDDVQTYSLTKSAISMAKATNKLIVAEGIETEAQGETMASLGCDIGQGYFYGRPHRETNPSGT